MGPVKALLMSLMKNCGGRIKNSAFTLKKAVLKGLKAQKAFL